MKILLAGFFFIGLLGSAFGQANECEQTLSQAAEEFNAGHFYGIPALLKTCIDRDEFTNEQKVRAYLLLCQAYLIIDDPAAAEDSYLKLLKADPEYIATYEKDPVDVVYLSKKFTSTPIFTPHLRIGINTSFYRSIYDINTSPSTVRHVLKPGVLFGAGVDWNINDNVSLCANAVFSTKALRTERSDIFINDNSIVTEKQFWLDVPVFLKYSDNKGIVRPFGYIGGALNVLINSQASMVFVNVSSDGSETPSQGAEVDLRYLRKALSRSLVVGGGVRYKIGRDFLFADVRYMAGLSNLSKRNIYSPDPSTTQIPKELLNNDPVTRYVQAGSFFRMDNLSLSIGYVKPLYDPRKVKNARGAKKESRKIRKQGSDEAQ